MRAILIDPEAKTVTEVDLTPTSEGIIEQLAGSDDPSAFIFEQIEMNRGHMLFLDEDGNCKPGKYLFEVQGSPRLVGRALITGWAVEDGQATLRDATLPVELIRDVTTFPPLQTTGRFTKSSNPAPNVVMTGEPLYEVRTDRA